MSLPGVTTQVRLGRVEFEEAIRPGLDETVAALHRVLDSASVDAAELSSVLLVGGSARIPLVTQAVSAQLGRPVTLAADPKGIVAIGAALAARGLPDSPPTRAFPLPAPVVAAGEPLPLPRVAADEPFLVPGGRPPLPIGPPRARDAGRRWLGVPRTVATAVAATVLAVALTGGIAYVANRTKPAGSGADPANGRKAGTGQVTQAPTTTEDRPPETTREKPPVTTTVNPPRTRKSDPPRMSTTTTTRTPPSSTTTTPTTTSTTQSRPSSAGAPPSLGGA